MGTALVNHRRFVVFCFVIAAVLFLFTPVAAQAWRVELVSLSSEGEQTADFWGSQYSSISHDGRFVSFSTRASNLVPNDTNNLLDIFVRDRKLRTTTRVNVASDGSQITDDNTYESQLSGDGRFVVFSSRTSDLAPGLSDRISNVYLHELETGETVLVSTGHDGSPADGHSAFGSRADISYDGRFIVFDSAARNLIAGGTSDKWDVFVYDRNDGSIALVPRAHGGGLSNGDSLDPAISANGRYIVFSSRATNLVEGVAATVAQIYRYDRETGAILLVSGTEGGPADGVCSDASVSRDGRFVVFMSSAANLADQVPAGNRITHVYLKDMESGSMTLATKNADGEPGDGDAWLRTKISPDGRYTLFHSKAKNLLSDNSIIADFFSTSFLYDHQKQTVSLIPTMFSGVLPDNPSTAEDIADEGKFLSFSSDASNLVPNDTNNARDVFVAIQVTDPWSITPTAQLGGWRNDVAVEGTIAALAEGPSVTLHDISGDTPQKLATLALPVEPTMIAMGGNRLYGISAWHWNPGLFIVADISDPANPVVVGSCEAESPGGSMVARGDYVYYSHDDGWGQPSRIRVVDVSDPENPVAYGSLDLGENVDVRAFTIKGNLLYGQGSRDPGRLFFVYDLSDPLEPELIGELAVGNFERSDGLSIAGNLVYSAIGGSGVRVVDVSDPSDPSPRALFPVTIAGSNRSTNDVHVSGNLLYVASSGGVAVYDVSDPENAELLGTTLSSTIPRIDGDAGHVVALTSGDSALHVIRMSNGTPTHVSATMSPTIPNFVFAAGDRMYIGSATALWVYDATDPYNPTLLGRDARWRDFYPKALQGELLIGIYNSTPGSAWAPNSFGIVDVSETELQEISTLELDGVIRNAAVSGTKAYLLGEESGSGAVIIDFSSPATPTQTGTIVFPGSGPNSQHAIAASDTIVCIAGITADGPRIHVFDVQGSGSPQFKAELIPSGTARLRLWLHGATLFISSDNNDFQNYTNYIEVYNLEDPTNPQQAGYRQTDGVARDLTILSTEDYDPIILLAKPWGSVHTYGYSSDAGALYDGPVCPSPNSVQVSVSQTPNSSGSYTVITSDQSFGAYIQEITRKPRACCLTTSVMPLEAAADGCIAQPERQDPAECNSSVGVSATAVDPWVFKEWTGAAQGTDPIAQALVTGSCSQATAWFWRPELYLSPGQSNPHDGEEFYGITGQYNYQSGAVDVPIIHITLTANEVDDWRVTALTFRSFGSGNEKLDLKETRLYLGNIGGALLGTGTYNVDNGSITFSFNVIVPAGESRSFLLVYDFNSERAWPCNSYGAQIDMGAVAAEPVTYPPGSKFPPDDPVIGGPSRVKGGDLVKQEGSDLQYGQADDPASENNPLENPLKVRLARQHPDSVNFVSFEIISPAAHGGFLDGAPGTRRVEKPVDAEGYAEASLTLGTRKGMQNPYDVELDMSVKGGACISSWAKPSFRAFGMGLEYQTEARYDNPANAELFGTYLSDIEAVNRFTLTITDIAPPGSILIQEVRFTLGGRTVIGDVGTPNVEYYADFDMAEFPSPQKMLVTIVMERDGSIVEQTAEYDVKILKLPGWISVVEAIAHPESFFMEFSDDDGGTYHFAFTYPTNFMWSDTIPGDVGFLGGLGNDLDVEFTAEAAYRVDETSIFGALVKGDPTILGYQFGLEGGLSGEFDPNFAFQRGSGMLRAEFGFDLPSKGYSKTFIVYGVPITAAVDLSGNVDIFIRGGAVLNRHLEFEEITVAPGTTVTGHITVSLSAVFGLAKIAATGSPTATVEIEIRYTSADGTTTVWRGEVAVPITVVGSIFWGLGSAELYSTTLGPWMFGDGAAGSPLAFRSLGDLPTPSAPRLLTSSALAVGDGARLSVWIGDTTPEAPEPNPDVFFSFHDGSSWSSPAPIIGDASPNLEWEMDPAAVFMAQGRALACWTANRGDKELDDLNAILAAQEIACALWDGGDWASPVYLTHDDRADGLVSLAYGGGNAFAVWVHTTALDVADREAWKLRFAMYDDGAGHWTATAPVPGTDTGSSDQMPSVAAGVDEVVLVWARDDDGLYYTENPSGLDGEPLVINGTTIASEDNEDSHIMWSRWNGAAWTSPAYVATGGTATRLFPSLAAAPNGSFLAVWTEKDPGEKQRIRYSVLTGETWSAPGTVVESDQFLEDPKAVVDSLGKATVIWRGYTGGGEALFASSTPGLAAPVWSEPQQITHDSTVQWQPVVVLDGDDKVVASWTAYDAVTWQDQSGPGMTAGLNIAVTSPGTAELTGEYTVALPDVDEDGRYDGIVVSVEVTVIEAGSYEVRGDLYAGTAFIARASDYRAGLTAGSHPFALVFPGGLISNRGLDGPYSLRNVVVIDRSGTAVTTASTASPDVATEELAAADFVPGPLSLDTDRYVGTLDQAVITLADPLLNANPGEVEYAWVRVAGARDGKGFEVALTETGPDTGVFRGTLGFSLLASKPSEGRLLVADHDLIQVVYEDGLRGYRWLETARWTIGGAGDVNGDGVIDLADAILALQVMSQALAEGTEITPIADVDGDGRIGAAEALYVIQKLGELR